MSFKILQDALITYQNTVKVAKINYFSAVISRYNGNSKVLFNTINSALNPSATCSALPTKACDDLLNFFAQKVIDIRMQIMPGSFTFSFTSCTSASFNKFSPLSLQSLSKIIG